MDSLDSYEFHKIFYRASFLVSLKGALTAEEIRRRVDEARKNLREMARETTSESEKKSLFKKAKFLEILMEKGFAEATIREVIHNPYGFVGLTLHFDKRKAEKMRLAFERARKRRGIV